MFSMISQSTPKLTNSTDPLLEAEEGTLYSRSYSREYKVPDQSNKGCTIEIGSPGDEGSKAHSSTSLYAFRRNDNDRSYISQFINAASRSRNSIGGQVGSSQAPKSYCKIRQEIKSLHTSIHGDDFRTSDRLQYMLDSGTSIGGPIALCWRCIETGTTEDMTVEESKANFVRHLANIVSQKNVGYYRQDSLAGISQTTRYAVNQDIFLYFKDNVVTLPHSANKYGMDMRILPDFSCGLLTRLIPSSRC